MSGPGPAATHDRVDVQEDPRDDVPARYPRYAVRVQMFHADNLRIIPKQTGHLPLEKFSVITIILCDPVGVAPTPGRIKSKWLDSMEL